MQIMKSPTPPPLNDIAMELRDLARQARRAQVRALLPVIDELSRQGVPHKSLAAKMTGGGIPITATALRKALSRWRRQTATSNTNPSLASGTGAPPLTPGLSGRSPSPPLLPPSSLQPGAPASGGITSKADLVRLRNSQDPIDLTQLAEIGRKK